MIYTYDETTGGAKRIDWDLTCIDWTKDEDEELLSLVKKFLAQCQHGSLYFPKWSLPTRRDRKRIVSWSSSR